MAQDIWFYCFHNIQMWDNIKQKGTSYGSLYIVGQKYFTVCCCPCHSLIAWIKWPALVILWLTDLYILTNFWVKIQRFHKVMEFISQIPVWNIIFASNNHNEKVQFLKTYLWIHIQNKYATYFISIDIYKNFPSTVFQFGFNCIKLFFYVFWAMYLNKVLIIKKQMSTQLMPTFFFSDQICKPSRPLSQLQTQIQY